MAEQYEDLMELLPKESLDHPDCCGDNYRKWETEIANPILTNLGFERISWMDGERDSFGPLSRICHAFKGDVLTKFIYG